VSASPSASTTTESPSRISPASNLIASGSCTSRWISRLSGRAPNAGSYPLAREQVSRGVGQLERERPVGQRAESSPIWMSTISRICSGPERVEHDDLVDPVHELGPEEPAHVLDDRLAPLVDRDRRVLGRSRCPGSTS
jgi:hypothetical protein